MAALFLRELPALRRLRDVLRERLVGRLAAASAAFGHAGAVDGWFGGPTAWMRDARRAGVGGFGDLALHLVDALSALGADEPPRLAAVTLDRDGAGTADIGGSAVGTWAGAPLTVRASWAVRPGGLELAVAGSAGTAVAARRRARARPRRGRAAALDRRGAGRRRGPARLRSPRAGAPPPARRARAGGGGAGGAGGRRAGG